MSHIISILLTYFFIVYILILYLNSIVIFKIVDQVAINNSKLYTISQVRSDGGALNKISRKWNYPFKLFLPKTQTPINSSSCKNLIYVSWIISQLCVLDWFLHVNKLGCCIYSMASNITFLFQMEMSIRWQVDIRFTKIWHYVQSTIWCISLYSNV